MKVIELLNMMSEKEKLPKKIKWSGVEFYLKDKIKYYDYEDDIGCSLFRHDTEFYSSLDMLNDEVEIIEEDKAIDLLDLNYKDIIYGTDFKEQILSYCDNLQYKINELVKSINELKKGK